MRTRTPLTLVGLATTLTIVLTAPGAHAGSRQFTYVGDQGGETAAHSLAADAAEAFLGRVELDGSFRFQPSGSSFTLRLDDQAVPDGQTVEVWVYEWIGTKPRAQSVCLPLGWAHTFRLKSKRPVVNLVIAGPAKKPWDSCQAAGTAGTGTVSWR